MARMSRWQQFATNFNAMYGAITDAGQGIESSFAMKDDYLDAEGNPLTGNALDKARNEALARIYAKYGDVKGGLDLRASALGLESAQFNLDTARAREADRVARAGAAQVASAGRTDFMDGIYASWQEARSGASAPAPQQNNYGVSMTAPASVPVGLPQGTVATPALATPAPNPAISSGGGLATAGGAGQDTLDAQTAAPPQRSGLEWMQNDSDPAPVARGLTPSLAESVSDPFFGASTDNPFGVGANLTPWDSQEDGGPTQQDVNYLSGIFDQIVEEAPNSAAALKAMASLSDWEKARNMYESQVLLNNGVNALRSGPEAVVNMFDGMNGKFGVKFESTSEGMQFVETDTKGNPRRVLATGRDWPEVQMSVMQYFTPENALEFQAQRAKYENDRASADKTRADADKTRAETTAQHLENESAAMGLALQQQGFDAGSAEGRAFYALQDDPTNTALLLQVFPALYESGAVESVQDLQNRLVADKVRRGAVARAAWAAQNKPAETTSGGLSDSAPARPEVEAPAPVPTNRRGRNLGRGSTSAPAKPPAPEPTPAPIRFNAPEAAAPANGLGGGVDQKAMQVVAELAASGASASDQNQAIALVFDRLRTDRALAGISDRALVSAAYQALARAKVVGGQ